MRPEGAIPTLTLHQPWATLIAKGLKTIETRTSSRYVCAVVGKTFAIHAGETLDGDAWESIEEIDRFSALTVKDRAEHWARGAVVAVGCCVECWLCTGDDGSDEPMSHAEATRRALCDARQRYCYRIESVHELSIPVVARGYHGVWSWMPPDFIVDELLPTGLLEGHL